MHRISFAALALTLGSGTPLQAQEATDNNVSLSGFGTVGVVHKTGAPHWGLIRSTAQKGAAADLSAATDSRFGAQIDWNHSSGWEAAAQGVLLPRAKGAFSGEAIEQAYVG